MLAVSLVLLVASGAGGPGWDCPADRAVLAAYLQRTATSPLYDAPPPRTHARDRYAMPRSRSPAVAAVIGSAPWLD